MAVVLTIAIATPIAGVVGNMNVTQPTTFAPGLALLDALYTGQVDTQRNLASLERANGWLNSAPLTAKALQGKVVLVDFWTYTCINWLRTLPYIRAWDEKYRDKGLVVIGVHSPEFGFEKAPDNVRRAVEKMRIGYPVAIDSDHAIWRAFDNQYWPALYLIDSKGRVRHHQFGEGSYEESERVIRELLAEVGSERIDTEPVSVDAGGIEAAADWDDLRSPENYVGYARTQNFVSTGGLVPDKPNLYEAPSRLSLNEWALSGEWTVMQEGIVLSASRGRIAYRFHARDLHLVMGPPESRTPVRFRVLIDGQPPGGARGIDVDEEGYGTLTDQRLYQLVRQTKPIVDRKFEIEFFGQGAEVFAFTFG